jgi:hypothetical protein
MDEAVLSLLDKNMWPAAALDGFHAMQVLPGTGPQMEILRVMGSMFDQRVYRPIGGELSAAVKALDELNPDDRVGIGYGGSGAVLAAATALQRLAAVLAAQAEDAGLEVPPLAEYLGDPERLWDDLAQAITRFIDNHIAQDVRLLRSFSLILFRETDGGGAIVRSLVEERPAWRAALAPGDPAATDLHLVIIPPPTAAAGIAALARELGCGEKLPCVVFLGDEPLEAFTSRSRLLRWGARTLAGPPPSIPEQLAEIYRGIYGAAGTGAATVRSAAGARFIAVARERVNGVAVLQLLAGATGGSALVGALTTVLGLMKPQARR